MSDRDELAALIDSIVTNDPATPTLAADAILARWRLVPVEQPKHWPTSDTTCTYCELCGEDWPCHTYLVDHDPVRIHGAWDKEQERYADGCRSGDVHYP